MRYFLWIVLAFYFHLASAMELTIADKAKYQVKVAQTRQDLAKGLMFVKQMPYNEGMLFDLRSYGEVSMWMKNTYIPLDMLFIDCAYRIVDIKENCQPLSLDKIVSDKAFCYVLEINGGEVAKHKLNIGDELRF